jgi:hypothetical protein
VIAGDRPTIAKRSAVLTLHASERPDTADSADAYFAFVDGEFVPSGVTEMKLWNPGREATARWEPFTERRNWRLVRIGSIGTVFVRFRDAAGNESPVFSDSISFVRP